MYKMAFFLHQKSAIETDGVERKECGLPDGNVKLALTGAGGKGHVCGRFFGCGPCDHWGGVFYTHNIHIPSFQELEGDTSRI